MNKLVLNHSKNQEIYQETVFPLLIKLIKLLKLILDPHIKKTFYIIKKGLKDYYNSFYKKQLQKQKVNIPIVKTLKKKEQQQQQQQQEAHLKGNLLSKTKKQRNKKTKKEEEEKKEEDEEEEEEESEKSPQGEIKKERASTEK
jgi:hypothetical protein